MGISIDNLGDRALEIDIRDQVDKGDYRNFLAMLRDCLDEHGEVNLLVHLSGFRGWSPTSLWSELGLDEQHIRDVSRVAIVGEEVSAKWLAVMSRPLAADSDIRFFSESELVDAREWVSDVDAGCTEE